MKKEELDMKQLASSLVIAFAMYSKIPMPRVNWEKENMQYAMCFFPLIGGVIGALLVGWNLLCASLRFGMMLESAGYVVIPILVTGGIHIDGFLDTVDALSSYQPKERKLEILKDPHTGAFAIIYGIAYGIFTFGLCSELAGVPANRKVWIVVVLGFMLSRSLSGLGVVTLRSAKTSGLLAMFQSAAKQRLVACVMAVWIVAVGAVMVVVAPMMGAAVLVVSAAVFAIYRFVAYKQFGGITGDLAGFFLVLCELGILAAIVVASRW